MGDPTTNFLGKPRPFWTSHDPPTQKSHPSSSLMVCLLHPFLPLGAAILWYVVPYLITECPVVVTRTSCPFLFTQKGSDPPAQYGKSLPTTHTGPLFCFRCQFRVGSHHFVNCHIPLCFHVIASQSPRLPHSQERGRSGGSGGWQPLNSAVLEQPSGHSPSAGQQLLLPCPPLTVALQIYAKAF